jgi:drug/metabolite transporter (DMT)-like permease
LPPALAAGGLRFERSDVVPVALLGTLQFGAAIALLNFGLQTVSSGRAALIFASFPLLPML